MHPLLLRHCLDNLGDDLFSDYDVFLSVNDHNDHTQKFTSQDRLTSPNMESRGFTIQVLDRLILQVYGNTVLTLLDRTMIEQKFSFKNKQQTF